MRILPIALLILSLFLVLSSSSSSVYANSVTAPKTITIPYEHTQIRNGPSTDDEIIHFAKKGTTFDVLADTMEWYKISNDEITGFVYKQLVDRQQAATSKGIENKTIVVDAGHGGNDVGAIGASGVFEKNLTYKTALTLQQELTALGANVILTRQKDQYISLASRTSLTNVTDADAFVSIHYNSVPQIPEATGIGTYYYQDYNQSLANNIQTELIKETNANDRGTAFGDYQVIRQNLKPAVLIELGFISNQNKEQLLLTDAYQKLLVNGIISGLTKYFYE
ncbi:N-acetylmuramoyl-L-alanine amidase [Virgibacillus sp. FSP13]